MAKRTSSAVTLQDLLNDYNIYDQYVDVVSAFEWLFTETHELAGTVRHFERFPKVTLRDGTVVTPDFTVLFNDGTGLIGEISTLARHENSVDKACSQIGKYATAERLPADSDGTLVAVTEVDVLQLVPADVGLAAVQRIIKDRLMDPTHPYKPPKRPVIAQFSRSSDRDEFRYTFQHLPDPDNGILPDSDIPTSIGFFLTRISNIAAGRFTHIKAARKFMNDPIKALYLATHLWTATWPTEYGSNTDDIEVTPAAVAETLRGQFGIGRAGEVRNALALLGQAGLAADNGDGTWTVSRKTLRSRREKDVHRIIARKASQKAKAVVAPRNHRPPSDDQPTQETLF